MAILSAYSALRDRKLIRMSVNVFNGNSFGVVFSTVRFFFVTINRFRNVNGNSIDCFDVPLTVFFNYSW